MLMDIVTVVKVSRRDFLDLYPRMLLYTECMDYVHIVKIMNVNKMFFGDDLHLRAFDGSTINPVTKSVILTDNLIDRLYLSKSIRTVDKKLYMKHRSIIRRDELEYYYGLSPTKYDVICEGYKFADINVFIRACFYMGLINYLTPTTVNKSDLTNALKKILDRVYVTQHNWMYLCKSIISITYMRDAIKLVGWDTFYSEMKNDIPKHIAIDLYNCSIITPEQLALIVDSTTLSKLGIDSSIHIRPSIVTTQEDKKIEYTREELINGRLHPQIYHDNNMHKLVDTQLLADIISCDYSVMELISMFGPEAYYLSQH